MASPHDHIFKLMTFNIRYGLADDGENLWDHRKHLVIDRLKAFDPDLLGMQECQDNFQAEFIKNSFQEYEFYGVRRANDGETAIEMAPILFKRSAFQLVRKGCFWLSDTPEVIGSKSWGSTFPRTATWVELIHQASGKSLIFLNTHFDYEPSAIEESARLLKAWIEQNVGKHPFLLTGDFNADKDSAAYQRLTRNGTLQDVYRKVHTSAGDEGTFHGFGQVSAPTPIDWILASHDFEVLHTEIDCYHEDNLYPSDHFPVLATLSWTGTGRVS